MLNIPRKVAPSDLVRVRHASGARYHVLASVHASAAPYLNTYTRGGNLIVARGATRPVSREFVTLDAVT